MLKDYGQSIPAAHQRDAPPDPSMRPLQGGDPDARASIMDQKFFGSFFQKRTAYLFNPFNHFPALAIAARLFPTASLNRKNPCSMPL